MSRLFPLLLLLVTATFVPYAAADCSSVTREVDQAGTRAAVTLTDCTYGYESPPYYSYSYYNSTQVLVTNDATDARVFAESREIANGDGDGTYFFQEADRNNRVEIGNQSSWQPIASVYTNSANYEGHYSYCYSGYNQEVSLFTILTGVTSIHQYLPAGQNSGSPLPCAWHSGLP